MAGELGGDVAGGRRMGGEIAQRRLGLGLALVGI